MTNKGKLVMHGNVLILQMISMRDKQTGLYLPLMDGNVNSMLHRIHSNLDNIENVIMILPNKELIDSQQLEEFNTVNTELFKGKITIHHSSYYKADVGATRKSMLEIYDIRNIEDIMPDVELIVSEFPVRFTNTEAKIVYNYNWGAVDDTNELLNESFKSETVGSNYHETYLYSDVQYEYWRAQGVLSDNVFRSTEIFDKDLFIKIANTYHEKAISHNNPEYQAMKMISHLTSSVVFFPMRIDDPRYNFKEVLDYCSASLKVLIITNPTNAPVPESKNCTLLDFSNATDKRELYFHILKSLRSCDIIMHHEKDMHISLLEHISISRATTVHDILEVNEYFVKHEA